jgi:hypothetical protein
MHGCCLERGKHPSGDMGGIITFSCNNLRTVCVKIHCVTFFNANYVLCKKTLFLNTGVFYEVFSALWQVMNVEFNGYPLHPLGVCCNYVGFNVTRVALITRTVSVMQSTN